MSLAACDVFHDEGWWGEGVEGDQWRRGKRRDREVVGMVPEALPS